VDFLTPFIAASDVSAAGQGGGWAAAHGWLHGLSNLGTASACLLVVLVLGWARRQPKAPPSRALLLLPAALLLVCGAAHLLEAMTFWWRATPLGGFIELAAAAISWAAGLALVALTPALHRSKRRGREQEPEERRHGEDVPRQVHEELQQEIQERRRAEQARQQSEERFARFLQHLPGLAWIKDLHGRYQHVNETAAAAFGGSPDELCGKTDAEIFPPATAEKFQQADRQVLAAGSAMRFLETLTHPDGTPHYSLVSKFPIPGATEGDMLVGGIAIDETDRIQAEKAVRESEERYRLLADALPHMVWSMSADLTLTFLNGRASEFTGLTVEQVNAGGWQRLVHPDDLPGMLEAVSGPLQRGEAHEVAYRFRRHDGEYRWVVSRAVPVKKEGVLTQWIGSTADVHDSRLAEQRLRQSEARFHQLADAMPQVVWTARPDGCLDYCNERWYELTGLPHEQGRNEAWKPILHPDDVQKYLDGWHEAVRTGDPFQIEYRFKDRKSGGYRWFLGRALPVKDVAGQVLRWFGTCTDIDETKRLQEALRESEEKYRCVAEALPCLVWTNRPDGHNDFHNRRWCEYTGLTEQESRGEGWARVIHPDDLQRTVQTWTRSLRTGEPYQTEIRLRRAADGKYRWFLAQGLPMRSDAGEIVHWFGASMDIEDQKQAEEALRHTQQELEQRIRERTAQLHEAKEAAELANRAKSEFLANMSHEIRTPMNGILGLTELVLEADLDARQREPLKAVKQSAEALLVIINDLLDFSKIEAGKLDLDPAPFRLRESFRSLLEPLAVQAREKGLTLSYEVGRDVPDALYGDLGKLRQVIVNLVGNAIKFTERGEVVVSVGQAASLSLSEKDKQAACPTGVHLQFEVRDTGIGIPADKLDAIFAPFVQADGSMTRRFGGTGLGLAICRRLVGMMNGRIWVESAIGQGSTFHFTLCLGMERASRLLLARPPDAQSSADRDEDLPSLRILLAEDNLVNQKVAAGMLERAGHRVVVVNNGRDAVAALERQPFDLVLMDVRMPEMDGLEATAAIREREKAGGPRTPIIALTAHALKGDRERFLAAGMDGYVSKPLRQDELREALATCLPALAAGNGTRRAEEPSSGTWDHAALLARLGGNARLFGEILRLFSDECPAVMSQMREAVAQRNCERIGWLAHSLKGTLGNLSATDACAAAQRLEELGRRGETASVEDAFALLQQQIDRLDRAVARARADLPS
jgi:PAS domain S-box-containing protein